MIAAIDGATPDAGSIRVLIAEDQAMFAEGLSRIIAAEPDLLAVDSVSSARIAPASRRRQARLAKRRVLGVHCVIAVVLSGRWFSCAKPNHYHELGHRASPLLQKLMK